MKKEKKMAKKSSKKMSLKKKIAAAVAGVALIVAAALGIKHVKEGMPMPVGTCLVSLQEGVVYVITGVSEDKYKMVVLLMGQIPVAQVEAPIRVVNKDDLPAFECKTGKPLNKKAEEMQKGSQEAPSEEQGQ